jgi:hypothetical protein
MCTQSYTLEDATAHEDRFQYPWHNMICEVPWNDLSLLDPAHSAPLLVVSLDQVIGFDLNAE